MEPVATESQKLKSRRRSQRVLLSIRIVVSGDSPGTMQFSEETVTAVVNAHGALILLAHVVQEGQLLTVRNIKSGEERTCRVIDVGAKEGEKTEIGIEFLEPSPRFWRVTFPPDDWSPRSPEARQYSGPSLSLPKSPKPANSK